MVSNQSPVHALLHAQSVAIVGASNDGSRATGRTLRYLLKYGFEGKIYPINPNRDTVQGVRAYPSVEELPEVPDVAVIVLPQQLAIDAVRSCGKLGIPFAIMFAAGFSEVGGEGIAAEEELRRAAEDSGIRLLGPNSNGAISVRNRATLSFMTGLDQDRFELQDHGISFVSQSGAMGGFIFNMAQTAGLGLGSFFSLGNEADLGFPEVVTGLIEEGSTKVIAGYIEGIRDGQAFEEALALAQEREIPLCFMKVGSSEKGAAAAASHTGALAGADNVYDGIFDKYGVQRAHNIEELLDFSKAFASGPPVTGNRMTIVTLSGGAGALMSDYAENVDIDIFPWAAHWQAKIGELLPSFASVQNPIDTTGIIASDLGVLSDSMKVSLENPDTDILMVVLGNLEAEEREICDTVLEIARNSDKPIYMTWVGGSGYPETVLSAGGVPTFSDPSRAMQAASVAYRWHTSLQVEPRPDNDADPTRTFPIVEEAISDGAQFLDEAEAKELFSQFGVSVVGERVTSTPEEAADTADEFGYPVVLKMLSREVAHKTEHGGVHLGVKHRDDVEKLSADILAAASVAGIKDCKIVVQQAVPNNAELIVGMSRDPVFGPVLLVGMGGVLAEFMEDVQIRPLPITKQDASAMLRDLRSLPLLMGYRGKAKADLDAVAELIVRASDAVLAMGDRVISAELNPVLTGDDGLPVAVDALIELATTNEEGGGD